MVRPQPGPHGRGIGGEVQNERKPSTVDEIATIVDAMPERLRLSIVLATFTGMREGEILEGFESATSGLTVWW